MHRFSHSAALPASASAISITMSSWQYITGTAWGFGLAFPTTGRLHS